MKTLLAMALGGFLYYSYTTGALDSWITQFEIADKNISEISCQDIASIAKGETLRNAFGVTFSVLKISNVRVSNRSASKLRCLASAKLSNGQTSTLRMEVYDDSDGDRFYEFRTQ